MAVRSTHVAKSSFRGSPVRGYDPRRVPLAGSTAAFLEDEEDVVKYFKLALLVVSGGALLPLAGCGAAWMLDALYILPQVAEMLQSLADTAA
jgi:hypothetical protein